MVIFPNCKINLGLRILRRREDGFHDLQTIFYPLPVCDILESVRSTDLRCAISGRRIPGDPADNLVIRAFHLLRKDFPDLPFVHIYLHKQIPVGGGLGGGSADGAYMLRLLNDQFHLGLGSDRLTAYAAQLGSDCPFFVRNEPSLGHGRGDSLEPLPLDLSGYSILLVHPGIHISTARAFSLCRPDDSGPSLESLIAAPVLHWRNTLSNSLEVPVFADYPVLRDIKSQLYARGALYAAMSGSGSCLFGIFEKGRADKKGWNDDYQVISIMELK